MIKTFFWTTLLVSYFFLAVAERGDVVESQCYEANRMSTSGNIPSDFYSTISKTIKSSNNKNPLYHRPGGIVKKNGRKSSSSHSIITAATSIRGGRQLRLRRHQQTSPTASSDNGLSIRRRLTVVMVASALFNDMLQISMLVPMLPNLIKRAGITTNTEIAMGIFFASKDIFQLSAAPFAGWLTTRVGGEASLMASTVALGLATFVFAETSSFPGLLIARSCQGAASAAVLCGGLSLIAETHPTEIRGSAMGFAYTGLAIGILCGPLIGGLLFSKFGQKLTFRIAATVVLMNAMAQLTLSKLSPATAAAAVVQKEIKDKESTKTKRKGNASNDEQGRGRAVSSFTNLLRNNQVLVVAISIALVNGFLGYVKPVSQIILEKEFELDVVARSFVITIATATCFIGTPIAGKLSDSKTISNVRSKLVAWSLLFMAMSSVFFCLRELGDKVKNNNIGLYSFNLSIGFIGLALAFNRSVSSTLLADLVDRHELNSSYGMAFALSDMADSLGLILGPILGLALSQMFGTHNLGAVLLGGACLLLVPAILQIA